MNLSLGGPIEKSAAISFGSQQYQFAKKRLRRAKDYNVKAVPDLEFEMDCWRAYTEGVGEAINIKGPCALPAGIVPEGYAENVAKQKAEVERLMAAKAMPEPRPYGRKQPAEVPGLGRYWD